MVYSLLGETPGKLGDSGVYAVATNLELMNEVQYVRTMDT
jgi:hypothetical protein